MQAAANVTVIPAKKDRLPLDIVNNEVRKLRVAAYARVSTNNEEQLTSYEAQVDYYTRYIQAKEEWEFVEVYTDEGISATNTKKRDGFNRMVADALAGKIDLIITKSISRFARNTVDTLTTVRKLKEKGIEVFFEKENIRTLDGKGELLITIMSSLAQEESRSISENVTWGQRKRFADGKVSLPYGRFLGYKKGENDLPEIVEEEAAIVRLIYRLFLYGKSPSAIASYLTDEGIPTPGGKKIWRPKVVENILTNEKYKGDALLQKRFTVDFLTKKQKINEGEVPQYYVANSHPAIIPPEVFDLVQYEVKQRKKNGRWTSSAYPFSGKIICGECGGIYGSKVRHSNTPNRTLVWQCNEKNRGQHCKTPHLTDAEIQTAFLAAFNQVLGSRAEIIEAYHEVMEALTDTADLDTEREQLQNENEVIMGLIRKAIEDNAQKAMDQQEYEKKYTALCERYEAARHRLALIDDDIWELHGPHYAEVCHEVKDDRILCGAKVQNGKDRVAVGRRCTLAGGNASVEEAAKGLCFHISLEAGQRVALTSVSAVCTTEDCPCPESAVEELLKNADYDALLAAHREAWEKIWAAGEVELEGDDLARDTVNYSLYHLNSIAPRHADNLSIPARGLSGQTYKGAVFWDSEMFILDYFLFTQPEVARSMVRYRIDTLPGALEKARQYGWQGAFYAWESQEGGFDGCSDYNVTDVFTGRPMRTFFRDKQVHISSAVARAIMQYVLVTGDRELLAQGGARTVLECARFYYSLLLRYAPADRWEIHDVIGPDEYHERVNNNAYTNRMALATIRWALEASQLLRESDPGAYQDFCAQTGAEELLPKLSAAAEKLYIPAPNEQGVIEQFDGYFNLEDASVEEVRGRLLNPREYWGGAYGVASQTQVIKQADVVTMLEFFHSDYPAEILKANWDYYAPRTEHGSSLSACMYALLSCRCGDPEKAYPFFMKSAQADWIGGGKQWAGLVYIGGTHPAAAGGAWKVLAQGFAGLEVEKGAPVVKPCLPAGWKKLAFQCRVHGKWYRLELTPEKGTIMAL